MTAHGGTPHAALARYAKVPNVTWRHSVVRIMTAAICWATHY